MDDDINKQINCLKSLIHQGEVIIKTNEKGIESLIKKNITVAECNTTFQNELNELVQKK